MPERALVIVPTYNECENIRRLIDSVLAQDARIDVLVVDDGSPDGTGALVDEIVASNDRVHVQHRARKLGLGTAYIVGFRWALERDYAYVLEMDADDFEEAPGTLRGRLRELIAGAYKLDGGLLLAMDIAGVLDLAAGDR